MKRPLAIILACLALNPAIARAGQPFIFPLSCTLGQSCFVLATPDLDTDEGRTTDAACGPQAWDNARSLDIGLSSISDVSSGFDVRAAADGVIISADNTQPDLVRPFGVPLPAGASPCGNGVLIKHAGGWVSAYCHLKKGSVTVQERARVQAGDIIGQVGLSGGTRWPKLSFTTLRNDFLFDPLNGKSVLTGCLGPNTSLFSDVAALPYTAGTFVRAGISPRLVGDDDVRKGSAEQVTRIHHLNNKIVLWATLGGVRKGDIIRIRLYGPSNEVLVDAPMVSNEDLDAMPIITTARNPNKKNGFATGTYRAVFENTRKVGTKSYAARRVLAFSVI